MPPRRYPNREGLWGCLWILCICCGQYMVQRTTDWRRQISQTGKGTVQLQCGAARTDRSTRSVVLHYTWEDWSVVFQSWRGRSRKKVFDDFFPISSWKHSWSRPPHKFISRANIQLETTWSIRLLYHLGILSLRFSCARS